MMVKPEDASKYACCSMPKPCEGDACMAWRKEFVAQDHVNHRFPPPPQQLVASGKGYCGLVYGR